MKQYIEIKADTHDADYVTNRVEITDEDLKTIEPVIEAIKNFKPYKTEDAWTHVHNFPFGERYPRRNIGEKSAHELYVKSGLCTEDEFETFAELLPSGDIHTITDIDLLYIANEEKLYEHKF
jgi:hypothetical protein